MTHQPQISSSTLAALTEALAERTPSPGGGAVAASVAALAAALLAMVAQYADRSAATDEHRAARADILDRLAILRRELLALADEDAAAYAELSDRLKRTPTTPSSPPPRDPTAERAARIRCLNAPSSMLHACVHILQLALRLAPFASPRLHSDLAIAAACAIAAARASAMLVRANAPSLTPGPDLPADRLDPGPLAHLASHLAAQLEFHLETHSAPPPPAP